MSRISLAMGEGSLAHNRRDYSECKEGAVRKAPENIDPSRTHENVELVDQKLNDAYEELFGEATRAYNQKQKRPERRIDNYLDKVKNSKHGEKLYHELIVQWGSKEDFEDPDKRERAKEALVEYVKDFQKRNPHLKVFSAHIHMDESSPHLHMDFIPWGDGYKNGMAVRNSLHQALKQQGIVADKSKGKEGKYNNLTQAWQKTERERFVEICKEHGLETEPPVPKAERGARQNMTVPEYKAFKANVEKEASKEAQKLLQPAREEVQQRNRQIKGRDKILAQKNKQIEHKDAYLQQQDDQIRLNDEQIQQQKEQSKALDESIQEKQQKEFKSDAVELFVEQADAVLKPYVYVEDTDELTNQVIKRFNDAKEGKLRNKGKFTVTFESKEEFDHAKNLVGNGHILKALAKAKDKAVEWFKDKFDKLAGREADFKVEKEKLESGEARKEVDDYFEETREALNRRGKEQDAREERLDIEQDDVESQTEELAKMRGMSQEEFERWVQQDKEDAEKQRKIKLAMAYAQETDHKTYERLQKAMEDIDRLFGRVIWNGLKYDHGIDEDGRNLPEGERLPGKELYSERKQHHKKEQHHEKQKQYHERSYDDYEPER